MRLHATLSLTRSHRNSLLGGAQREAQHAPLRVHLCGALSSACIRALRTAELHTGGGNRCTSVTGLTTRCPLLHGLKAYYRTMQQSVLPETRSCHIMLGFSFAKLKLEFYSTCGATVVCLKRLWIESGAARPAQHRRPGRERPQIRYCKCSGIKGKRPTDG